MLLLLKYTLNSTATFSGVSRKFDRISCGSSSSVGRTHSYCVCIAPSFEVNETMCCYRLIKRLNYGFDKFRKII